MDKLLKLLQKDGCSAEDAIRLVELYPELAAIPNARKAATAILQKRAERFTETEPEKAFKFIKSKDSSDPLR
jgi:hypothetical protein